MPGGHVRLEGLSRGKRKVTDDARTQMAKRLNKAATYLAAQVVRNLRRTSTRAAGPSRPGQIPHVDTGKLSQSIQVRRATADNLLAEVGTVLDYGRILEFHRDRSFLERTYNAEERRIISILKNG